MTTSLQLATSYSTALFLGCKDLSRETLLYFYSTNGFVSIKSCFKEWMDICAILLPVHDTDPSMTTKNTALQFRVNIQGALEVFSFIIAGRDLKLAKLALNHEFVELQDTQATQATQAKFSATVAVTFQRHTKYYQGSSVTTSMLVDSLMGIRLMPAIPSPTLMQVLVILYSSGTISNDQIESLINSCKTTKASSVDVFLNQVKAIWKVGRHFRDQGDFCSAVGQYTFARNTLDNYWIDQTTHPRDIFDSRNIKELWKCNIQINLDLSLLCSEYGYYHTGAQFTRSAKKSLEVYEAHYGDRAPGASMDVSVYSQVGDAYLANKSSKSLKKAYRAYSRATKLFPKDKVLAIKRLQAKVEWQLACFDSD